MSDIDSDDLLSGLQRNADIARNRAVGGLSDDPEEAARALRLAQFTGVPSTAIYADPDQFVRDQTAIATSGIVRNNPHIADYINSHPLAASVSNDDWGKLDELHGSLDNLPEKSTLSQWLSEENARYHKQTATTVEAQLPPQIQEAFEGWGQTPFSRPSDIEWAISHPAAAAIVGGLSMLGEAVPRGFSAAMHMGRDGLSPLIGEQAANELFGFAEYGMTRGDFAFTGRGGGIGAKRTPLEQAFRTVAEQQKLPEPTPEFFEKAAALPKTERLPVYRDPEVFKHISNISQALEISDPWTSMGKEPPYGLHPLIDKAKDIQSKQDIKSFDDAFQKAAATATRERSPDLLAGGLRQRLGDRQIGIDAEAVRKLYGDKDPSPDDNILGWDPGLRDKLEDAEASGDKVWVSMADYLAKTDPEIHKQLHDDIAVRSDGASINDTKIEAEPKQTGPDMLAQVKGAAGIEPSFMAGDRKITLARMDEARGKEVFGDQSLEQAEEVHDYDLLDEQGKPIGIMSVAPRRGGKDLWVHNIQAGPEAAEFYQPQFLGNSLIRDVARQLKATYPQMERMGGYRVTGARDRAGKIDTAWIKFDETPAGWGSVEPMRQLLQDLWQPAGAPGVEARVAPLSLEQQAMATAVQKELERIVPSQVQVSTVPELKRGAPGDIGGFYQRYLNDWPRIVVALDRPELALGTARHEAIHHLRQYGFINDKEWASLEQAARYGDWVKKNLGDRYKNLSDEKRLEEAVAEQFRKWAAGEDVKPEAHAVFEKIKEFIAQIKVRYKELTGKDLDWQELFQKIHEGEVGAREGNVPQEAAPGRVPFRGEGLTRFAERQERIASATYKIGGRIFEGPNHVMAMDTASKELGLGGTDELIDRQPGADLSNRLKAHADAAGFKTTTGRIVDRTEAARIAEESGQGKASRFGSLKMEDLGEPDFAEREGFGLYDKGKALGVTDSHMRRMEKLMQQQNKENFEWAKRKAEARLARTTRAEVKERRTTLRDEAREAITQRPDIATDQFVSKYGIKFHPDHLSEEQKLRLPKDYIQKKNGVNPDELAPYFGYTSGDALIERLGMFTEDRRRTGMSPRDYLNRLIDVETDRRLNQEFGDRPQQDLLDATDQAHSEASLRAVHEETIAYAQKVGKEPKFSVDDVKQMVKDSFDKLKVGTIDHVRMMQGSLRVGKKIEEAGAKGKWDEAYQLSQQREYSTQRTKLAVKYGRERAALDRTARTWAKRSPAGVPAEYTNWVHDLLIRGGYKVGRTAADLQENIGRKESATLKEFVDQKEAEWQGMRRLPIVDFLKDDTFRRSVDDLTYSEFQDYKAAIDGLIKAGRDEEKIYSEGQTFDRKQLVGELRGQVKTFEAKRYTPPTGAYGRRLEKTKQYIAGISSLATIMRRFDRGDRYGKFQRLITNRMAGDDNTAARIEREVSKKWTAVMKDAGVLSKTMDMPQELREWGKIYKGFTRENLLSLIQNMGNPSNLKVAAEGWGADGEKLFNQVVGMSTKEDWDRAQRFGDEIFKDLAAKGDMVEERINGTTVEKIRLKPFTIKFPDGREATYAGWYHPLFEDNLWKGKQKVRGGEPGTEYGHLSTWSGWRKARTGAIYPVDLSFSQLPFRISQMIHDITHRESVLEIQKIFKDPGLHNDITLHYGKEYADLLMPWLEDSAGRRGVPASTWGMITSLSNTMRANGVNTYIGFNPSTPLKHFPTAFFMSAKELGIRNFPAFAEAYRQILFSPARDQYKKLINSSEEIQRRERHWEETFGGAQLKLYRKLPLKEKMTKAGSYLVAKSDRFSADALWLARYNLETAAHGDLGLAAEQADLSVRRAHGSTAPSNLPELVRRSREGFNGWLTTVYGFMGERMQRLIETAHNANDAWGFVKRGQIDNAASELFFNALPNYLIYVATVGAVEQAVQSYFSDKEESWPAHLAKIGFANIGSSLLFLRELWNSIETGNAPDFGMFSTVGRDVQRALNDVKKGTDALDPAQAGKTVRDLLTVAGLAKGYVPKTLANTVGFGIDYMNDVQDPENYNELIRGMTRGDIHPGQRRK